MNVQQRLTRLERVNPNAQAVDLTGLVKLEHNADGTLTLLIGEA